MYTAFISDTRKAISDCWATVKGIHTQQERNNETFKEDYADSENAKLTAKQKAACDAAKEKIGQICDKAAQDAAQLDKCIPLNLDEPAAQRVLTLLSGAFTLNVEQVQHLVSEYIGSDTTLQNAVSTYCEAHGMRLNRATAETRRSGIEEIRGNALSIVSRIEASSYRNQGRERDIPLIVDSFAVDSSFGRELCQRLGQDFSGAVLSPTVEPEHPLNFHFQGVREKSEA